MAMFCIALGVKAQTTEAPQAAIQAVTAAHAVFLTEVGRVQGQEDIPGRMVRTTLEGTKRFTLLPSTSGADVILVLNRQGQPFEMDVRDSRTFALLDALQVPSPMLLTTAKEEAAVTQLLNALFSLDHSGPAPQFQVVAPVGGPSMAREAWSPPVGPLSPYAGVVAPKEEWSAGHSVLLVSDAGGAYTMDNVQYPGYSVADVQKVAQSFVADLGSSTGLRFVNSLADADMVMVVTVNHHVKTGLTDSGYWFDFVNVSLYDAKGLAQIVEMEQMVASGKDKKGKPTNLETAESKLAKTFQQKMAKNAAKK